MAQEEFIGDPNEMIPTSREEMEYKGIWEMYCKFYKVDLNTDPEKVLYIHKDNAVRVGLI